MSLLTDLKQLPSSVLKYADTDRSVLWPNDKFKNEMLKAIDNNTPMALIRKEMRIPLQFFYALLEADESFYKTVMRLQGYFQDELADRLLTLDEEMEIDRAVLRSRNIQWYLSRKNAPKYGDRLQVQVTHIDLTQALDDAKKRAIEAKLVTRELPSPDDDGSDLL